MERGCFILLEGLDRCGKSTQTKRLVEAMRAKDMDVAQMSFPDRTTAIGSLIDNYLRQSVDLDDQAIHLLFSANRWESQ